jgi:hypothetical protein
MDSTMFNTLSSRLNIEVEDAEKLMHGQQKLRDHFTRDFLDQDDHSPALYDLLFNNDRCAADKIVWTIASYARNWLDRKLQVQER